MSHTRQPHAPLDLKSRQHKGLKIERLLNLSALAQPIHLLEIGTGSGGISNYFGTHAQLDCQVSSVDVNDIRVVSEGYEFTRVSDTQLPFDDETFDVVLSNHVIEHVGDEAAQRAHLAEAYRVLKQSGTLYLAVPNRWMLVEPHYRLIFLSWLPHSLRTPYLKLMGKGNYYDCEPLTVNQLELLLKYTRLDGSNLCIQALRETFNIEKPTAGLTRLINLMPDWLFYLLRPIIPTLIYSATKKRP